MDEQTVELNYSRLRILAKEPNCGSQAVQGFELNLSLLQKLAFYADLKSLPLNIVLKFNLM